MKLVYLANIALFDGWAQTVQVMSMCEAFAENSAQVVLIVPKRKLGQGNPFEFYNVHKTFKIVELPYIDLFSGHGSVVLYWIRFISFLVSARVYLWFVRYDVLYTREIYLSPFFRRVYIERHSFSKKINIIENFAFRTVKGIVVLTSFIKEKIVGLGVSASRVFVAPDAVRLTDFEEKLSVQSARSNLNISHIGYIIGYIGTLKTMGQEKGVSTVIESLNTLPPEYILYVVGGEKKDIEFYTLYARQCGVENRVVFVGKVPHKEIPVYAQACNVLVAPFPDIEHYRYFMSPLKIFEYMASRRPMVVTDLPSLREVLVPDETAVFVPPSDPRALADAVVALTTDTERAERIAENAYREVVEKYTWKKRAENILKFIQS